MNWINPPTNAAASVLIPMGMANVNKCVGLSTRMHFKHLVAPLLPHKNGLLCYKYQLPRIVLWEPTFCHMETCPASHAKLQGPVPPLFFSLGLITLLDKVRKSCSLNHSSLVALIRLPSLVLPRSLLSYSFMFDMEHRLGSKHVHKCHPSELLHWLFIQHCLG